MAGVDPEKEAIPEKEHSVRRSCRVFFVLLVCFLGIAIVITSIMFHVICPGCPPKKNQEVGPDGIVRLVPVGGQPAKRRGIALAYGGSLEICALLPEGTGERKQCRERNERTKKRIKDEKEKAKEDRDRDKKGQPKGMGRGDQSRG